MTCAEARQRILEADPAALAGADDSELATHLAACSACTAQATRVRSAMERLDRELARAPNPPELAVLRELARTADAPAPAAGRRGTWRIWVPIAAAAAVAAVLLVARPPQRPPMLAAMPDPVIADVSIAPGSNAAVLQTDNPNITVIWFFQGETR